MMTKPKKKKSRLKKGASAGELGKHLDKLHDRLNHRLRGGKIKAKLLKNKKSNIPGFGYWFQPK